MATINLKYIFSDEYTEDYLLYIDIPENEVEEFTANLTKELADVYIESQRKETAYQRRAYRYKAHYSLDLNDGIESEVITETPDPVYEKYIDNLTKKQLYDAIKNLPKKQSERIYAHFILGMSKIEIARKEGVNKSQITRSIEAALKKIKIILQNLI